MLHYTSYYGFGAIIPLPFTDTVVRVKDALMREGFGVVTEIDMAATLRQKLGIQMPPYVILGACAPALARRALAAEPDVGLLLPCNVVVRAADGPGRTTVAALDPEALLALAENPALGPFAAEAADKLRRALAAVESDAPAGAPQPWEAEEVDESC